ncbi:MAG: hypothetical protein IJ339_03010 [Oscillospiraceae bacterium]|nr:hypothetical protein [Oscillospiraceae bacterium]MBQ7816315.1 hypothetical protein [Oscillospiraceae bacterium]
MISDIILKTIKPAKRIAKDIDHFSIQQVGSKFYIYAHPLESNFNRKKIGTYPSYQAAKAVVDSILDLKLPQDFNG